MINEDLITKSTVKERGWTDSVIKKYIGEPDQYCRNPHYRCAPPMQLFKLTRVEELEQLPEVAEALEKAARRSELRRQIAQKQSDKLLHHVESLTIKVPSMTEEALIKKACAHYNDLWAERGRFDKYASPSSSEEFLYRISVNFLRHRMTNYERELDRIFGKVGCVEGRPLLKSRILDKIAEAYPMLKSECKRQKRELLN